MLCAFLPWVPKSVEEPCHKPCKKTFRKSSVEFKSCWFELEGGGEHKDFSVWPHWIPVQVVGTEKCKMVDIFHPETINTWTRSKPVVRVLHQPLSQQTDQEDQTGRWLDGYGFPDSFVDWYKWASTSALPLGRPQVGPGMAEGIHTPLLYMHRNRGRTAFVWFAQGSFTGSQFPAAACPAVSAAFSGGAQHRTVWPRLLIGCRLRRDPAAVGGAAQGSWWTAWLCFLRKGPLNSLEKIAFLKMTSLQLISVPNIAVSFMLHNLEKCLAFAFLPFTNPNCCAWFSQGL